MAENCGHGDIHFKALLYGIAMFLTPFSDKIIPILFADQWPSPQMTVGCGILGIIGASLGLRAFYDGSYERSKNGYLNPKPTPLPSAAPAKTP